ncbi:tetratricopeptide repeat protein [Bifidobacterium gallicum]|nr:tetratricopeptide repeat protein [Bifidobacterium gallicum]KFI57875.1 putative tetratricopeptide repeat-containing domain protein [Bifidobacterium gallicum DSM 20093 = LMG 11596]
MFNKPDNSQATELFPLPEQDEGAKYVVIPGPQKGYVALQLPNGGLQILAWMSDDLRVYGTDQPISGVDEDTLPQLRIDPWSGIPDTGSIRVYDPKQPGRVMTIGEYAINGGNYEFRSLNADLGGAIQRSFPVAEFLALAWLSSYYIPTLHNKPVGMGAGRMTEVFEEMMGMPLPDAIDMMIWKGATNNPDATDFDRYVARQLVEAGAGQLRQIASEHDLGFTRLGTKMFWIFNIDELEGLQRDVALATEAAMNRLSFVDLDARDIDDEMGLVGTVNERMAWKSTSDALHMFAKHAKYVEGASKRPNQYLSVCGAEGMTGGPWDISTRFANLCESLMLMFRLEYRFDIDLDNGAMVINCTVPTPLMFPGSGLTDQGWVDLRAQRPAHAASYAMRLAALMAQMAFMSSVRLTKVTVNCLSASLSGDCVLSLDFDRMPFQMATLHALTSGALDNPALDTDPLAIYNLIKPSKYSLQFTSDRGLAPCEPLPVSPTFASKHLPVWADERELPAALARLLSAKRVCELDVMKDEGSVSGKEIWDIYEQAEDSPMTAQMELESVAMQLESEEMDHTDPNVKPLFCERPLMRALVALDNPPAGTTYRKVPDALYNVHLLLARIYRDTGNFEASIKHSRQAQALSPTTPQALVEEAVTHVDVNDDFSTAIDCLIRALQIASIPADVSFIYYRLAFANWQQGNQKVALACYTQVLQNKNMPLYQSAAREVSQLLDEMHDYDEIMSVAESTHVLKNAGIPVAPTSQVRELIAKSAIGLVDAGFPRAADDMVWLLGRFTEGDVIAAIATSLRWGCGEEVAPTEFQSGSQEAMLDELKRALDQ